MTRLRQQITRVILLAQPEQPADERLNLEMPHKFLRLAEKSLVHLYKLCPVLRGDKPTSAFGQSRCALLSAYSNIA